MNVIEPGAPMPAAALHGIVPGLITPLDDGGRIDEWLRACLTCSRTAL